MKKKILGMISLLTIPALSLITTSCSGNGLKLSGGDTSAIGTEHRAGQMNHAFIAQDGNEVNFNWSLVTVNDSDISHFKIINGLVSWDRLITENEYTFRVTVVNANDGQSAVSDKITVIIEEGPTPGPTPDNLNIDPTDWESDPIYHPSTTTSIDKLEYTNDPDGDLLITGFKETPLTETDNILNLANSYNIDGTNHTVTSVGQENSSEFIFTPFANINMHENFYVILPPTITHIKHAAFAVETTGKVYCDMSACNNVIYSEADDDGSNGYWFAYANVGAFIPPTNNTTLTQMPDDMFEYAHLYCDIDLSGFINMHTIGHWSCAQWYFMEATGGENHPCGTLVLPKNITTITWASFFGSIFNHLYWDSADLTTLTYQCDTSLEAEFEWSIFFPFMDCYIKQLHVNHNMSVALQNDFKNNRFEAQGDIADLTANGEGGIAIAPINGILGPWHDTSLIDSFDTTYYTD